MAQSDTSFNCAKWILELRDQRWSDARIKEAAEKAYKRWDYDDIPYKREYKWGHMWFNNLFYSGILTIPAIFLFVAGIAMRHGIFIWAFGVILLAWISTLADYYICTNHYIDRTYDETKIARKQWDLVILAYVIPFMFYASVFQWFIANGLYIIGILMCYVVNPLILICIPGVIIPLIVSGYVSSKFDK